MLSWLKPRSLWYLSRRSHGDLHSCSFCRHHAVLTQLLARRDALFFIFLVKDVEPVGARALRVLVGAWSLSSSVTRACDRVDEGVVR